LPRSFHESRSRVSSIEVVVMVFLQWVRFHWG
jgi:hypothetical protein